MRVKIHKNKKTYVDEKFIIKAAKNFTSENGTKYLKDSIVVQDELTEEQLNTFLGKGDTELKGWTGSFLIPSSDMENIVIEMVTRETTESRKIIKA